MSYNHSHVLSSPSAQVSFLGSREDSDTCGIQDMSQWNLQHYIFDKKFNTPSVPNDLSVLIGTQILRNLWGICENAQLGFEQTFQWATLHPKQSCQ
jgi:hypothetical protein